MLNPAHPEIYPALPREDLRRAVERIRIEDDVAVVCSEVGMAVVVFAAATAGHAVFNEHLVYARLEIADEDAYEFQFAAFVVEGVFVDARDKVSAASGGETTQRGNRST